MSDHRVDLQRIDREGRLARTSRFRASVFGNAGHPGTVNSFFDRPGRVRSGFDHPYRTVGRRVAPRRETWSPGAGGGASEGPSSRERPDL